MGHKNQVAERDVTSYSRWGVAPSFAFGLNTPTSLIINYVHEHDRNLPEYGIPLRNYALVPGVDRNNYYGFSNVDVEKNRQRRPDRHLQPYLQRQGIDPESFALGTI